MRDLEQTFITDSNIRGEKIAELERENDACKAVLTSYRVLVECVEVPESWQEERSKLLRLTTQLLKDEQREG